MLGDAREGLSDVVAGFEGARVRADDLPVGDRDDAAGQQEQDGQDERWSSRSHERAVAPESGCAHDGGDRRGDEQGHLQSRADGKHYRSPERRLAAERGAGQEAREQPRAPAS